jgi:hypothetical protein
MPIEAGRFMVVALASRERCGKVVRLIRMIDPLTLQQWYGAGAGALAALIVSLDVGRRPTGFGFVIFVTSSIALIAWGFLDKKAKGIGTQTSFCSRST